MYIKDLLSHNGNFLSHSELNDKYKVGCNLLNILQLKQCISSVWRRAIDGTYANNIYINRNNTTLIDWNGNILDVRQVNCKTTYWIFEYEKLRQPSCIN